MKAEDIDFLIIGAAKCATTWLQKGLQADPLISMPDPELHYFSRFHDRGDDWYFAQFPVTVQPRVIGEKSNSYLDEPAAPTRVKSLLPHARLIVQLRNPVERAYSDYCMLYRRGEVGRDIASHLGVASAKGRFLNGGCYLEQLERYHALYPDDRILVMLFDDMLSNPAGHLNRVRGFLGLPGQTPREVQARTLSNKVKDRREAMVGARLRRIARPLRPLIQPFRHTAAFRALRGTVAREISYPPLSQDLRARLVDFYARDVESLGRFLRRDLSSWLQASPPTSLVDDFTPNNAEA